MPKELKEHMAGTSVTERHWGVSVRLPRRNKI